MPQVIEGFGEQAIAKPLSAASGRQRMHPYRSRRSEKLHTGQNAPSLSLLLLMELQIA